MIVVTGATGQLGGAIVADLRRRLPAGRIAASVRDAGKAGALAALGVEVRVGDFADAGSLRTAFAGAEQVLIVSVDTLGDQALQLHRAALQAAVECGVRRILYTSHVGARVGSTFVAADQHARTEMDLGRSGLAWTSLRHGFYAESCLWIIGHDLRAGELRMPEDGPVSWTARADLAQADAAILADAGQREAATPPLAAGQALTMAEIAAIASEATGREVRHKVVADEAWREARIAAGMPAAHAEMLLGMFRAARRGDFAASDPTLERLLGRTPRRLGDLLTPLPA